MKTELLPILWFVGQRELFSQLTAETSQSDLCMRRGPRGQIKGHSRDVTTLHCPGGLLQWTNSTDIRVEKYSD